MRYYFCYSSALDSDALEIWKQQHGYPNFQLRDGELLSVQGLKLVFDFPSRFWGGRVAGLEDAPGHSVEGVLFEISDDLWAAVEHKEGVMTGASIARQIVVDSKRWGRVPATAFTTHPSRKNSEGPLSPSFLETLTKAYRKWNFSAASLEKLKG